MTSVCLLDVHVAPYYVHEVEEKNYANYALFATANLVVRGNDNNSVSISASLVVCLSLLALWNSRQTDIPPIVLPAV